jgi:uncharacterized membrane protein YkvA (DUF1232 family)
MAVFSRQKAEKEHNRRQKLFTEDDLLTVVESSSRLKNIFRHSRRMSVFFADFKLLMAMVADYYHRRYRTVPWFVVSSIGASLLYVLTPIDLIPDLVPLLGFIDDAAVLGICLKLVHAEVEKYRKWKETINSNT